MTFGGYDVLLLVKYAIGAHFQFRNGLIFTQGNQSSFRTSFNALESQIVYL
jgi:hypothetical protein